MTEDQAVINAVGGVGVGILVLDGAGRITRANSAATELLGWGDDDLVGSPVVEMVQIASLPDLFAQIVPPATFADLGVLKALAAGGTLTPVRANLTRWTSADGQVWHGLVFRAALQSAPGTLQRDRELHLSQNAIRSANLAVFEYDPVVDRVIVSDIWRQMLEIDASEALDEQVEWRSRVHPDDLDAALEPVDLCLKNIAERAVCEYRLRSRDGSRWRWMQTEIAVQERDGNGRATRLIGVQKDITEKKEIEDAHRVAVDQFRSAFEHAPIGKAIIGLGGMFLRVNAAMCVLLGLSEEDLLHSSFHSLTHPDDLQAEIDKLDQLKANLIKPCTFEKRYVRPDGAVVWGLQSVAMVRDARGAPDHFVSQVVDVTEQRQLSEMKSEFVSHVSHELRTPLTSILGALGLLRAIDGQSLSEDANRLLHIAQVNGERLKNLVNDILDFQNLSTTRMRFALLPHPVGQLIDEATLANFATAESLGVRFRSGITDRSLAILVDAARFQQVMTNLLTNAAKFADTGSTIEIMAEPDLDCVRISVTNIGPGIPDFFRDNVFMPFAQAVAGSNSKTRGTGLGLTISKGIVEQMGGEIGFDSVPGGKTTFWLKLRSASDTP